MSINTRDRVVEAAAELLHEHPYHSVGVQGLCDRAGVCKGSFDHLFESRQELTIAAVDRSWQVYERGLAALHLERSGSS